MRSRTVFAIFAASALLAFSAIFAQDDLRGYVAAVSDGNGSVKLFWPMPDGTWPSKGYTVQRTSPQGGTAVIAQGLRPGYDPRLMEGLAGSRRDPLKQLEAWDRQVAAGKNPGDFDGFKNYLFLFAVDDFSFAKAMGLAWEDHNDLSGPVVYQVMEPDGKVVGLSMPVNPKEATPPGDAPPNFRGAATPQGVALDWDLPTPKPGLPIFSFRVKREGPKGFEVISKGPILPGDDEERKVRLPRFIDDKPPVDREVRYIAVGVDVFGRETAQAGPVSVFVPDFEASYPPKGLKAEVKPDKVSLTWEPSQNPRTAGYLLERSNFYEGPFVSLTEKPLAPKASSYIDSSVQPGQRYYYRVTSLDNHQKTGAPSTPVMALARASAPPPPPENLTATIGTQVVVLKWAPCATAIAGYRVERLNDDKWERLSDRITPEPAYSDMLVMGQGGTLTYRVIAIGNDGQPSEPSAKVVVALPPAHPPSAPKITSFDATSGKVSLDFEPGGPPEEASGFIVLRAQTVTATPEVITPKPISAQARNFVDEQVFSGATYVYRVVAVDGAQNHSEPSAPITVRVGERTLSPPPPPSAKYVASPFPQVIVSFTPAPGLDLTVVQRKAPGETQWMKVAGPLPPGTAEALDSRPPKGAASALYRVYYQTAAGTPGPPSQPVEVKIQK